MNSRADCRQYRFYCQLFVGLLILNAPLHALSGAVNNKLKTYQATCTNVIDGDSLYIKGVKQQIRLWGVDAPERDEPGYSSAKSTLQFIAKNKELLCRQKDIDKYGRIVAHCWVSMPGNNGLAKKGLDINRELIERKVAKEYCRFTRGFFERCR